MSKCIYDLGIRKPWSYIFQYPMTVLFLADFHLTWRHNEAVLRGDIATNISCGMAKVMGLLGGLIRKL